MLTDAHMIVVDSSRVRALIAVGVYPNPNSDGTILRVSTEIQDLDSDVSSARAVQVRFTLGEAGTDRVVVFETHAMAVGNISHAILRPPAKLQSWSPQTPVTYTLTARIIDAALQSETPSHTRRTGRFGSKPCFLSTRAALPLSVSSFGARAPPSRPPTTRLSAA